MTNTTEPRSPDERFGHLREQVAETVCARLPAGYRALLFGSRATGQAGPRLDWDIGIVGPAPLDGAILERIREALEEVPTLATFEVVDWSTVPEEIYARLESYAEALVGLQRRLVSLG